MKTLISSLCTGSRRSKTLGSPTTTLRRSRTLAAEVPTWQVYSTLTHVTLYSLSVRSYICSSSEMVTLLHRRGAP